MTIWCNVLEEKQNSKTKKQYLDERKSTTGAKKATPRKTKKIQPVQNKKKKIGCQIVNKTNTMLLDVTHTWKIERKTIFTGHGWLSDRSILAMPQNNPQKEWKNSQPVQKTKSINNNQPTFSGWHGKKHRIQKH